jgi:hypothetical protein
VYGGDIKDEAAAADAAGADGDSSPAAAAVDCAAGGVDGIVTQENGEVPFFLMDAFEAPERPGESKVCLLVHCRRQRWAYTVSKKEHIVTVMA